jgi:hypothetical protein
MKGGVAIRSPVLREFRRCKGSRAAELKNFRLHSPRFRRATPRGAPPAHSTGRSSRARFRESAAGRPGWSRRRVRDSQPADAGPGAVEKEPIHRVFPCPPPEGSPSDPSRRGCSLTAAAGIGAMRRLEMYARSLSATNGRASASVVAGRGSLTPQVAEVLKVVFRGARRTERAACVRSVRRPSALRHGCRRRNESWRARRG